MQGVLGSLLVLVIVLSALGGMVTGNFGWLPRKIARYLLRIPLRLTRALAKLLEQWGSRLWNTKKRGGQKILSRLVGAPMRAIGFLLGEVTGAASSKKK